MNYQRDFSTREKAYETTEAINREKARIRNLRINEEARKAKIRKAKLERINVIGSIIVVAAFSVWLFDDQIEMKKHDEYVQNINEIVENYSREDEIATIEKAIEKAKEHNPLGINDKKIAKLNSILLTIQSISMTDALLQEDKDHSIDTQLKEGLELASDYFRVRMDDNNHKLG